MLDGNPATELFVDRLREFFDPKERWFRGLWEIGPSLAIAELLEAAEAADNQILSDSALQWMASDLLRQIKADPSLPSMSESLKPYIVPHPSYRSPRWYALTELQHELGSNYLERLADLIDRKPLLSPERVARAVAAHILDWATRVTF